MKNKLSINKQYLTDNKIFLAPVITGLFFFRLHILMIFVVKMVFYIVC